MIIESKGDSQQIQDTTHKMKPELWITPQDNEDMSESESIEVLYEMLVVQIQEKISKHSYNEWFSGFSIEDVIINNMNEDNTIVIGTDTQFKVDWLEARYLDMLKLALKEITNEEYEVSIVVRQDSDTSPLPEANLQISNNRDPQEVNNNEEHASKLSGKLSPASEETSEPLDAKSSQEIKEEARVVHLKERYSEPVSQAVDETVQNANNTISQYECPLCGSEKMETIDEDANMQPNHSGIVSIQVRGTLCSGCGMKYYNDATLEILQKVRALVQRK